MPRSQTLPESQFHVLALVPYFVPHVGGGETHLYQLAQLLDAMGHSTTVLTQGLPGSPECERRGRVEIRRFGSVLSVAGKQEAYGRILDHLREGAFGNAILYVYLSVGLEYCTSMICETLAVARSRGIPRVVRIPSSRRVLELAELYPAGIEELSQADVVIALNPGIRSELVAFGVAPERIRTLPNGVNTGLFQPAATGRPREAAGPVFLCPGRFVPKKRLEELLRIWSRVEAAGRALGSPRLWLVGDPGPDGEHGEMSRRIHGLVTELALDGVRIFGAVPHSRMPSYYQEADGYVSLSVQEGMSNALLEAMACALPVIAPATDSVLPLVRDGWNGFLFAPGDPEAAEGAILRFLRTDPAERCRMGERGWRRIQRDHRIQEMARRFADLFRDLALATREVHPCSPC